VNQALPKATPLPPAWSAGSDAANVTDDWVKSFKDDELGVVVREAIANNLDLRQSADQVEEARQTVIVVGSKLKPQIGATIAGATTRSSNAASSNQYQSNMEYGGISWEIDVWGQVRSQRAAVQENYEAVALDYAFARQSLAATTAKSWYPHMENAVLDHTEAFGLPS
jgi:outer membrane protein, multidrug efflux system